MVPLAPGATPTPAAPRSGTGTVLVGAEPSAMVARAASAIAAPVANRSAGSFASARPTRSRTGAGISRGNSGGSSSRCRTATCNGLSPVNGGPPVRQQYATAPSA
ncbi:hypothetical protein C5N14_17265 [Micromonospora sp. MW-13]|nr:hypothetical protein C5N14_17265 [Micromonospora sp. MW-13]